MAAVRIVSIVMSVIRATTMSAKVTATEVFMDGLRLQLPCWHRLRIVFRFRIIRRRVVIHNQTRAALARQECPHPLDENADSEIGRGQKLDMDSGPGEPGKESAQMNSIALQNGKAF